LGEVNRMVGQQRRLLKLAPAHQESRCRHYCKSWLSCFSAPSHLNLSAPNVLEQLPLQVDKSCGLGVVPASRGMVYHCSGVEYLSVLALAGVSRDSVEVDSHAPRSQEGVRALLACECPNQAESTAAWYPLSPNVEGGARLV
jgi:hypothetical protein